jgi:Asp-tRNA(Asn)/Glu-tRNA(Gln) amidotransferase A subunit family amidase
VLPSELDGSGLRVALSPDLGWAVDPEVRANTLAVGEALRAAGVTVDEVDLVVPRDDVMVATAIHFRAMFIDWIAGMVRDHPDEVCAYSANQQPWCDEVAGDRTYADGLELEARLYAPVGALLEDYDALICPTCGTRGLEAGDDYVGHGLEVGGETVPYYFASLLTPVFNVMSRLPVLAVPSGFADNGVPTGVQIAGRSYDDVTVFRVGAALEAVRPWDRRPETVEPVAT